MSTVQKFKIQLDTSQCKWDREHHRKHSAMTVWCHVQADEAMFQNTFTYHQFLAAVASRNIKNSCSHSLSPKLDQIYLHHPNWWRDASGPELSLHVLILCSLTQVTHNPLQSLCSHGGAKPECAFIHTKSKDEWLCANRDHSANVLISRQQYNAFKSWKYYFLVCFSFCIKFFL